MKRSRLFLFLLIVFAHLLLLQLLSRKHFTRPTPFVVIPVTLLDTATVTKFVAAPPKLISPKKIRAKKIAPVLEQATSTSPEAAEQSAPAEPAIADSAPASRKKVAAPAIPSGPALSIVPPPSARYSLDVVRFDPKVENPYYGSGEIRWDNDGANYTMQIEVGVDILLAKIRLFKIESEGTLGSAGIKPRMVTETRRGRSETATHFNYEDDVISFSSSTAIIALTEGAQDKATAFMQLAGIGNADPEQFQPGKDITMQVAEEKEANPFLFTIVGQEKLDTKLGNLTTWHIVRPPRVGTYSSQLDIWLAPELNWLPAQIRNTEANGAITTQTIRKILTEKKS